MSDAQQRDTSAVDQAFFGWSQVGEHEFDVLVDERLSRTDQRLYGGTAVGASVALASLVTERSPLWMTTQFVSTVPTGTTLRFTVDVTAPGHRTNQVAVTARSEDGSLIVSSLGACGRHRQTDLDGEFEPMPVVSSPEDSAPWRSVFEALMTDEVKKMLAERFGQAGSGRAAGGHTSTSELRLAERTDDGTPAAGTEHSTLVWARRPDDAPITPAVASFLADMVPMSTARALGRFAGGSSLDNTMRFSHDQPSEWVLFDIRPHGSTGGYAHGDARMWTADGRFLGTASQTFVMREFDPLNPPWIRKES